MAQSPDDDEDIGAKTAVIGGGFLTVKINDRLAFQPELLYSKKGE